MKKETEAMRPGEPMKNPLGSSYPVDVLAQLESDPLSRRVFDAMPGRCSRASSSTTP